MKIFNIFQADWMYKRGAEIVGLGTTKEGETYVSFNSNDKFKEIMNEWCEVQKYRKQNNQESKRYFFCYSANLKNFLLDNGLKYDFVAVNKQTNKTFWKFERNERLKQLLTLWNKK